MISINSSYISCPRKFYDKENERNFRRVELSERSNPEANYLSERKENLRQRNFRVGSLKGEQLYGCDNRLNQNCKMTPKFLGGNSSNNKEEIQKGDNALNENKFEEALASYTKAQNLDPDNIDLYKKIAKVQFHLKNYEISEENYKKYLEKDPQNIDVLTELGEVQRQKGDYKKAINTFESVLKIESNNDLAKRSILETKNNILSCYNPMQASKEKAEQAKKNLNAALNMAAYYLTPQYMQELSDVKIRFGETSKMGGTSNIAQYENSKNTITVSNTYIYAAPEVIAAYLVHETVHAKDNDPYTSVKEEQDAYKLATEFWINNSKGIKDPEMDYAAELYKESPSKLSNRVEEIYVLRDPDIAKTSPNHPPEENKKRSLFPKHQSASQSLKSYNIIA